MQEVWKNRNLKDLNGEIWKEIEGYDGDYFISNYGRVKSFKKHNETNCRILKPGYKHGYAHVILHKDGNRYNKKIHRLVLSSFRPIDNSNNFIVNHLNGNKMDNRLDNIEWCTYSENEKWSYKIGLKTKKGEKNSMAKLKNGEVWLIKKILNSDHYKSRKISQEFIGKMFNVNRSTISDIKNNRTWIEI